MARQDGLEAVNAMVEGAAPLVDVIWRDLLERYDQRNPDQRAAMAAEIKKVVAGIRNVDVRESYREALRTLYRTNGERSRATSGRHSERGPARNVAMAVEGALILGVIDMPAVIEGQGENIAKLAWRAEQHQRIVDVLYDASWLTAMNNEPLTRDIALEAIEKAGLTEYVGNLRRLALRLPFATESDPQTARALLIQALRDNFT